MSEAPLIRIVCPCYFDVPAFLQVREAAKAALAAALPAARATFLVVDDTAGADPEVDLRLGGREDITIVRFPRNLGHQGALVQALRRAAPMFGPDDIVVTMDADGEDRPGDIPALISPLLQEPGRPTLVAVARRTQRTESALFRACYLCFKVLFRVSVGRVVRSGNFLACRGRLLREIIRHPYFDRCYSAAFVSLPLELRMVPLPRGRRYAGESKMSTWGLFRHGLRMLLPFADRIALRGAAAFILLAVAAAAFHLAALCGASIILAAAGAAVFIRERRLRSSRHPS